MSVHAIPTLKVEAEKVAIEMLEEMLAMAKVGEVTEVMIIGLRPSGEAHTWATPLTRTLPMLGALEELKFSILSKRQ